MARNVKQVYDDNPSTTIADPDLFYIAASPFGLGDDTAITFSDLVDQLSGGSGLNLGTMAFQNANAINVTGGSARLATLNAGFIYANLAGDAVLSPLQTNVAFDYTASPVNLSDGVGLAAFVNGFKMALKNTSSGNVTFTPFPGDTIDGAASLTLAPQQGALIMKTATQWSIIAQDTNSTGVVSSGLLNQLAWYAATGSTVSGLATAANGVLVTSAGSVPSITSTLGQGLAIASSVLGVGAANNIPFNTGKGFQDNNGNELLLFTVSGSAVNYLTIRNEATANGVSILTAGDDAIVGLNIYVKNSQVVLRDSTNTNSPLLAFTNAAGTFSTKLSVANAQATDLSLVLPAVDGSANFIMKTNGSGVLSFANGSQIAGTATNDNASAGNIGEYISSNIAIGSAVSLVSATSKTITSISLTAGDWDISAVLNCNPAVGTTTSVAIGAISIVNNTLPTQGVATPLTVICGASGASLGQAFPIGPGRQSLSATTTIYLIANVTFAVSTMTAYGFIAARRAR